MDFRALRLASELGGLVLAGPTPGHTLLLVERTKAHGLPGLLVIGREPEDLQAALAATERSSPQLNLLALLPLAETELALALPFHRVRLGSLLGAIDAGLPWLGDRPMMAKRLPGRIRATQKMSMDPAPLRPLERADLLAHLTCTGKLESIYLQPAWEPGGNGYQAPWWPGVALPPMAEVLLSHLTLPSHTPFTEALRSALRLESAHPVPWLPHPGSPAVLHALGRLTSELAAFRGSAAAWEGALARLAALPAPPHFCARC